MTTCIMSSLPGTAAAPATMGAPTALPPLAAKPRTQTCCALPQGVGAYASARITYKSPAFALSALGDVASWGEAMRAQPTLCVAAPRAASIGAQAAANTSAQGAASSWAQRAAFTGTQATATTRAQPAESVVAPSATTCGALADDSACAQRAALNSSLAAEGAHTQGNAVPASEMAGAHGAGVTRTQGVWAQQAATTGAQSGERTCASCFRDVLWEQNLAAYQSTGLIPPATEALALPPTLLKAIAQEMAAKKLAFNAEAAHGTFGARVLGATLPDDLLSGAAAAVDGPTLALWARDLAGAGAPYLPADASAALVVNETRRDLRRASAQDTLAASRSGWTPLDDTALLAPLDPVEPVPLIELGQAGVRWDDSPLSEPLPRSWRLMSLLQAAPDLEPDMERKLQAALEAQAAYAELCHDWRSYDGLGESGYGDSGLGPWAWDDDLLPDPPFLSQADLDWIADGWNDSSAPLAAVTIPVQLPLKEQVRRRQEREQEEERRQSKECCSGELHPVGVLACSSMAELSEARSASLACAATASALRPADVASELRPADVASELRDPGALWSAAEPHSSLLGGCYD